MKADIIEFNTGEMAHERIMKAKAAYTTRRVDLNQATALITLPLEPHIGDLVLARVDKIGQHQQIELANGRKAKIFTDDEIIVVYGNRYAPDQFEALMPETLSPCHLVAAGGVASAMVFKHARMKNPTGITPIALLGTARGKVINLKDFALGNMRDPGRRPFTVAIAGTAMNSGKTTTAANLVRGLSMAGFKVGAAKVTGTGAGGDIWFMKDAGARIVLDFIDTGFPSTYRLSRQSLLEILKQIMSHLSQASVDTIVLEIADGLYQEETMALISSDFFRTQVDGMIFAAKDAMSAKAGVDLLKSHKLPVIGLSGLLTQSPLAIREAQDAVNLPVFPLQALSGTVISQYFACWVDQSTDHLAVNEVWQ